MAYLDITSRQLYKHCTLESLESCACYTICNMESMRGLFDFSFSETYTLTNPRAMRDFTI